MNEQVKQDLELIIVETGENPSAAVIWLHGLGADGNDFVPIVPELDLPEDLNVRFIFPHAPMISVTLNNGYVMRAWYDIFSIDRSAPQDQAGIRANAEKIVHLIETQLAQGIAYERIFLAGFSQGGALALHTALRYPHKLAGIIALSTYLPLHDDYLQEKHDANQFTPVMMVHGTYDPVVPYEFGKHSYEFLKQQGQAIDWTDYPMQHQVCMEEILAIGEYIKERLTKN
ncbi:MAG: alpha/beta hydrolase fold domain-containing protein [Gammaproteobacteria bacterium]|nr:alpha/beta hydrolase fold domain-containing protein [Gammaproteobacteria bacterium]NNC97955.1 alpha/beta hydrolase fold domain-containing protein [Gammaproteobacteria bacterium]NNM13782.1 alpha/beta hydrolase fold domain-containing protein [Gammaproteobacteria bacterium]